uniref:retron St85 family effector protein n=1 Tax=Castellaniella defragrans TaxID=75697 RepID=UPI00334196A5
MQEVLTCSKSAIGSRLEHFTNSIRLSPPRLARSNQLIFLCGANKSAGVVSERRSNLKKFIENNRNNQSNNTVIYAEGIFNELKKFGSTKNALDLEHTISEVADRVIIILESESAFCELGAFSHEALRGKLIVINNSKFRESESFINTGPIAALQEVKSPVLWYPMKQDGVCTLDGIGSIFHEINTSLAIKKTKKDRISMTELSEFKAKKESLYFLHDLILLCGPISHEEIILLLKKLFGDRDFKSIKNLLGILREAKLVSTKEIYNKKTARKTWVYSPTNVNFYFEYQSQGKIAELKAAFRTYHLKTNLERFVRG